jgi:hypothetical protein
LKGNNAMTTRSLYTIAQDIRSNWPKPYFGAVPYIDAMRSLQSVNDKFYHDDGKSVVLYFLANAGTWRGDAARRIKAELKALVGIK